MEFAGELETHLTVVCEDGRSVETLRGWGEAHGWKCIHIVLAQGACVSQPMLTRRSAGGLSEARAEAARTAQALDSGGYAVTRIKIEAAPGNDDIPRTADDAKGQPEHCYFEHHVKLLLQCKTDVGAIAIAVEPHGAHLSRNALRAQGDDRQERFVTQRCRGVGREAAHERLTELLSTLRTLGYPVLEVEEEYVVYDSNTAVDDGWLPEQEA